MKIVRARRLLLAEMHQRSVQSAVSQLLAEELDSSLKVLALDDSSLDLALLRIDAQLPEVFVALLAEAVDLFCQSIEFAL